MKPFKYTDTKGHIQVFALERCPIKVKELYEVWYILDQQKCP